MADQSEQPNDAADAFGDAGFNQDDIDALLGQAGGAASAGDAPVSENAPSKAESPPDQGNVDQNDVDALINGTGDSTETPSDQGNFDQSDIDALMNAAGDTDVTGAADGEVTEAAAAPETRVDTLGRPFDEAAAAMQAAIDEERAEEEVTAASAPAVAPPAALNTAAFELDDLPDGDGADGRHSVTMLNDVDLNVRIQLGQARMLVEDVLKLDAGSVIELDKLAGDPVDVFVNDRLVARGEVLVLNDNFCVRISDVFSRDPHRVIT